MEQWRLTNNHTRTNARSTCFFLSACVVTHAQNTHLLGILLIFLTKRLLSHVSHPADLLSQHRSGVFEKTKEDNMEAMWKQHEFKMVRKQIFVKNLKFDVSYVHYNCMIFR